MTSPAYRDGGLMAITFDESSDSAACCGENSALSPAHPNVLLAGKNGPGGGPRWGGPAAPAHPA